MYSDGNGSVLDVCPVDVRRILERALDGYHTGIRSVLEGY